jgi:hypothetical protein
MHHRDGGGGRVVMSGRRVPLPSLSQLGCMFLLEELEALIILTVVPSDRSIDWSPSHAYEAERAYQYQMSLLDSARTPRYSRKILPSGGTLYQLLLSHSPCMVRK